jgi:prepilin peptidase CpaA
VNLVVDAPLWLVILLAICLIAAAIEDVVRLRISNITSGAVLLLGLLAMAIHGFPAELWQNAIVFLAVLALGTLAFAARMIGGGDVKLLAAVASWVNFSAAAWLLAAVFISGGVLAFFFILARPMLRRRRKPTGKHGSYGIPYGLAIVAGATLVFGAQINARDARFGELVQLYSAH